MSRRQSQILQQKKKFPVIKLSSSYRESKWPGPRLKNRETKGKKNSDVAPEIPSTQRRPRRLNRHSSKKEEQEKKKRFYAATRPKL